MLIILVESVCQLRALVCEYSVVESPKVQADETRAPHAHAKGMQNFGIINI